MSYRDRLDSESLDSLEKREARGRTILSRYEDEPETNGSDAISDILTALFGAAGYYEPVGEETRRVDRTAAEKARALLDRALTSYEGDAEDYTVEAEPEQRPEVGMTITFAGEAYDSYREWVERGIQSLSAARYFVQVEAEDGEKFDAWLIGVDREAEMGNTLVLVRNTDNGATEPDLSQVESVEVSKLHVW